jgi:hypothetical protein
MRTSTPASRSIALSSCYMTGNPVTSPSRICQGMRGKVRALAVKEFAMPQRTLWVLAALLFGAAVSIASCGGGAAKPDQQRSSSASVDEAVAKAAAVNPQALADGVYTFKSACNGKPALAVLNGRIRLI